MGAPSAYTHTVSVKAIEPTKEKYATVAVEYPSAPPHKNTMIKGIIKALKRTVGNPHRINRYGSFFMYLPTMYALNASKALITKVKGLYIAYPAMISASALPIPAARHP